MPYTFKNGLIDAIINNTPHPPFVDRVWITISPTSNRIQNVTDKRQFEWECNCGGNSWTTTTKFTDYKLFVEHGKHVHGTIKLILSLMNNMKK